MIVAMKIIVYVNRVKTEGTYASDRTIMLDRGSYRNDTKAE